MNNKRVIDLLMISVIVLPLIIFFFDVKCIFKSIFNIPCISCGLTRAFISILHLDFVSAFKYNVLSIPLFVVILLFIILYLISKIYKKEYIYILYDLISKYYYVVLIILLLGWIINLIFYYCL